MQHPTFTATLADQHQELRRQADQARLARAPERQPANAHSGQGAEAPVRTDCATLPAPRDSASR